MSDNPLKINVEKQSLAARGQRRVFPWMPVAGLAIVAVAAVLFALRRPSAEVAAPTIEPATPRVTGDDTAQATAAPTETIVDDDGQTLWISPTAGEPISLSYLPLGTQLLLHLRPADLLAHAEGEKVVAALGPFGRRAIDLVERELGRTLSDFVALVVAVSPRADGGFDYALRAELLMPEDDTEQLGRQLIGVGPQRARFLPRGAAGRVLVSCPVDQVAELIDAGDEPPRFARDVERLLRRTDAQRMATLVLPSKFLETGGLQLLGGRGDPLRAMFRELVGDAATAVAFSLHWDDDFFFEMQSTVALDQRPYRFAAALEQRVRQAPDKVEDVVLEKPPSPHGRKVVARLPIMLRELSNHTRSGAEEGVSITRGYLPATAGHNLLMAAELLLSRPGE